MLHSLDLTFNGIILRPRDAVREHFADVFARAAANVQLGMTVIVHEQSPRRCLFTVETTHLWGRHRHERVSTVLDSGDMIIETIGGPATGTRILYTFDVIAPEKTLVGVHVTAPLRGLTWLLSPFLKVAGRHALDRSFVLSKRSLEGVQAAKKAG